VLVGDRRKYLAALVTLSAEGAREWAAAGRLTGAAGLVSDMERLGRHPEVVAAIQAAVDQVNGKLPSHETIKRFAVLPADFTQESGELTPSLKVRRKVVAERHAEQIERLYREEASPPRKVPAEPAARP
jgi:long-chain acyl-CoA synthetase